ncbi:MAG: M28 family peptidase [Bacteroidota bacterium]
MAKPLLDHVQALEGKSRILRRGWIRDYLYDQGIHCESHRYRTGENLFVPSMMTPFVALGTHYDTVAGSPGANDNASAIAVALEVLRRYMDEPFTHFGLQVFFFDEEEKGLLGSQAYVEQYGVRGMLGLLNMELVGMGEEFALWPLREHHEERLLLAFESQAKAKDINCTRLDKIIMHTADHVPFRAAGIFDAWTITRISQKDREVAAHYYKAMEFEVDSETLLEIIEGAPIFEHYHRPSDLATHLTEQSLIQTADTIWETLQIFDQTF